MKRACGRPFGPHSQAGKNTPVSSDFIMPGGQLTSRRVIRPSATASRWRQMASSARPHLSAAPGSSTGQARPTKPARRPRSRRARSRARWPSSSLGLEHRPPPGRPGSRAAGPGARAAAGPSRRRGRPGPAGRPRRRRPGPAAAAGPRRRTGPSRRPPAHFRVLALERLVDDRQRLGRALAHRGLELAPRLRPAARVGVWPGSTRPPRRGPLQPACSEAPPSSHPTREAPDAAALEHRPVVTVAARTEPVEPRPLHVGQGRAAHGLTASRCGRVQVHPRLRHTRGTIGCRDVPVTRGSLFHRPGRMRLIRSHLVRSSSRRRGCCPWEAPPSRPAGGAGTRDRRGPPRRAAIPDRGPRERAPRRGRGATAARR